jgi:hypothetical protein
MFWSLNKNLLFLLAIVNLNTIYSISCPASCPLIVTGAGTSKCCSAGDGAPGCGACQSSSCPGNSLAKCNQVSGANCVTTAPGCSIQRATPSKFIFVNVSAL